MSNTTHDYAVVIEPRKRMALALLLIASAAAHAGTPPRAFAPSTNNVMGAMPSPAGKPPGIVLLGPFASPSACETAAYRRAAATSWTYHHCDLPPAASGNYSCHCYVRTDGVWTGSAEARVDSGDMSRSTRPPPPPPSPPPRAPPRCADELDCGLNGACDATTGACACEAPWTGPSCSVLDLAPVVPATGLHAFDQVTGVPTATWGGSVVGDDEGGYLMFAAEMVGHCGIGAWETNSRVILAKAASAVGPYTFVREVFPAFAHEPTAGRGPNGEYVVWFTRYEHLNSSAPCGACVDGTTPSYPCAPPTPGRPPPFTAANPAQSYMSWAADPLGEWSAPVMVYNGTDGSDGAAPTGDTNLAPVIYPNGSLVGLWRGVYPAIPSVQQAAGMGIYVVRATNWKDPATYDFGHAALRNSIMRISTPAGGVYRDEEDPHVWLDAKGRLHAVVHLFLLGGHLASDDGGRSWRWYGPVTYPQGNSTDEQNWARSTWPAEDGAKQCAPLAGDSGGAGAGTTQLCFQRRERPHIIFDSDGRAVAVGHGVVVPNGGDYCYTVIQPTTLWAAEQQEQKQKTRVDTRRRLAGGK